MPIYGNEPETRTWFANLKPAMFPIFWATQFVSLSLFAGCWHQAMLTRDRVLQASISDADADSFVSQVYGAIFLGDLAYYSEFRFRIMH